MKEMTMLQIKTEKDVSVYLRERSYGNYDGRMWSSMSEYTQYLEGTHSYNYLVSIALQNSGLISTVMDIRNVATTAYHLPYFTSMQEHRYDIQKSDTAYFGDGTEYSLYFYSYDGFGGKIKDLLGDYSDEELAYRAFVYENYLTIDDETLSYMNGLIAENGFYKDDLKIISRVAKYIQNSAAYNLEYDRGLDGEDNIVIAFLDTYKEGICQHYASAATLLFRALGIPARYTVGYMGQGKTGVWSDVTNKMAHAWVEVYIDTIGWIPVEVTGSDNSGGGGGGGAMVKELTIRPADVFLKYDGTNTVLKPGYEVVGLEELLEKGYTYDVTVSGERSRPGITPSVIESFSLYDANGVEVTDNFKISFTTGKIQIYLEELFITTGSFEKIYDGTPLTNTACKLTGETLYGHTVTKVETAGSLTDAGKTYNGYVLVITDDGGNDITDYYKVNATYGILEVKQREIHIIANSATKEFDGTPLEDAGYTIVGEIAEGDYLEVVIKGSQTSIGKRENAVISIDLTDVDDKNKLLNYKITHENGVLFVMPPMN